MKKTAAVEGMKPNGELDADFRRFDAQKLSAEERRKILIRKHGGKP